MKLSIRVARPSHSVVRVSLFLFALVLPAAAQFSDGAARPISFPGTLTNSPYAQTLSAFEEGPINWSVADGALPAGLSPGSSTGVTSSTSAAVVILAPDTTATNTGGSNSQQLSGTRNAPPVIVTTSPLLAAVTGSTYTFTMAATGKGTITWSITSGALPVGLSLGFPQVSSPEPPRRRNVHADYHCDGCWGLKFQTAKPDRERSPDCCANAELGFLVAVTDPDICGNSHRLEQHGVTWSFNPALGGGANNASTFVYAAPITAPTTQTVTIMATSMADPSKAATAVITLLQAVSVSLSPSTVSLAPSDTQSFTATVLGANNSAVTWSLNPPVGTISSAGLYTAPSSIQTSQTVTVTAQSVADVTKSASTVVSLSAPAKSFTFYVDSVNGLDSNPGTLAAPWKTIGKVNSTQLLPGQSVGFASGGVWREKLIPGQSGTAGIQ